MFRVIKDGAVTTHATRPDAERVAARYLGAYRYVEVLNERGTRVWYAQRSRDDREVHLYRSGS